MSNQDNALMAELEKHCRGALEVGCELLSTGVFAPLGLFFLALWPVDLFCNRIKLLEDECQSLMEAAADDAERDLVREAFCRRGYLTVGDTKAIAKALRRRLAAMERQRTLELVSCAR